MLKAHAMILIGGGGGGDKRLAARAVLERCTQYQIMIHKNFCQWTKGDFSNFECCYTTTDDLAMQVRVIKTTFDRAHVVAESQHTLRGGDFRQVFIFCSEDCYAIRL
jgi:hypothetical protein